MATSIVSTGPGLAVRFDDGTEARFHPLWLRDNCRCEDCGIPETGRRRLRLSTLDLGVTVRAAHLAEGNVAVDWSDGHSGRFPASWLADHLPDAAARQARAFSPRLWDDAFRADPPLRDFSAVAGNDADFLEMLECVRDAGFCFLRGAPAKGGELEPFATRIGPIQESNFGRVQDLIVDAAKKSVANSTIGLKPHTDEPYRASPPGILLFHCIETDVTGQGSSTFLDGFEAASVLRAEDPEGFAALTRYPARWRRHFAGDVDLIAEAPIISTDRNGNLCGLRVNDRVAAPLALPEEAIEPYYRALKRLLVLCEDPARMIERTLRPGDVAIFDNHRILHGRTALTMHGRRWLQWLGVKRGDFHSALRITADRLGRARDVDPMLRGAY